jgi:hypothetical protein
MIAKATKDLLIKMQSCCPDCGTPGFTVIERFPGLPLQELQWTYKDILSGFIRMSKMWRT